MSDGPFSLLFSKTKVSTGGINFVGSVTKFSKEEFALEQSMNLFGFAIFPLSSSDFGSLETSRLVLLGISSTSSSLSSLYLSVSS